MNGLFRRRTITVLQSAVLIVLTQLTGDAAPPFNGTIFLNPDIVTGADPSAFASLSYEGIGRRQVYDRRANAFLLMDMHLAKATYFDGRTIEVQVNPEFGSPEAVMVAAEKYAWLVGQLPAVNRSKVQTLWIHQGTQPFGGGNANILIHTGQAALYEASGILEETLVHESTHTSFDAEHANAADWVAAQRADPDYISTYARDNPTREDLAESFLLHLALRHRKDRLTAALASTIERTMPNRMAYFDQQQFNLYPFLATGVAIEAVTDDHLVAVGQPTTLNVIASGSEPMSYQWYLGESGDTSQPFPGATASSFVTPGLASTVEFWVRVSNPFGPPADSRSVRMTVH